MGQYYVDEAGLREPNLLVPGKKPVGSVKIDWSHPLTEGLISACIFNEGFGPLRDLARPGILLERDAYSTNPVAIWNPGPFGMAGENSPTTSFWTYTQDLYLTENEYTFLFIGRIDALTGVNAGFFRSGDPTIGSTFIIVPTSSGYPWMRVSGTDVLKVSSGTVVATGINRLAFAFSGSAKKQLSQIDVNGEQSHSSSTAGTLAATEFIHSLGLQYYPVDNERIVGQYSTIYIYEKYLGFAARQNILTDPFQFLISA